jgi:hypothetical protein
VSNLRYVIVVFFVLSASTVGADDSPVKRHWSLQARSKPTIPKFEGKELQKWVGNPIDAFVLQRLQKENLRPAHPTDPRKLIRRLTFDLTGLPPTPDEIDQFLLESAAKPRAAYEALIDRLLASPRYGERWGRHWLDVVRFAESEGFEYDRHLAGSWRYRDYVIDAFNKDMPFDRFIIEQIAGDEIDSNKQDLLIAAGFNRLGPVRRNAGNQALAFSRDEVLTEMIDAVGTSFLGLTIGCARCHDHKFDPIPQLDYYRMQAFMAAAQEHDVVLATPEERAEWKARTDRIQPELTKLQKKIDSLTGDERAKAEARILELQKNSPLPLPAISTVRNVEKDRTPIHLLKRGNTDKKEQQVGPRLPSAFVSSSDPELAADVSNPRTVLANWIASPDHPLTARVIVNRVWQWHFGRGIVESPNDFGINGSRPSHPELLDWLANEFVASGWRIKALHRLILLSNTYRQASDPSVANGRSLDPDARLLSRFPARRLDAEEIRDAMLAIAGRLNEKRGGPSVIVPVEGDLVKLLYAPAQWAVTKDVAEHDRRSVYLLMKRNLRLPFFETFDQPDAQTSCGRRESSTHALQALELLNGKLANNLAHAFAQRLQREAGDDAAKKIERAFLLVAGRLPNEREKERSLEFLKTQPFKEFALAMFNTNGFLYVK